MIFGRLRDFPVGFITKMKRKHEQSQSALALSEKSRLLHRLNSIDLNENEARCLQAYLTTLLEARPQHDTSNSTSHERSNCIVLEMNPEDLQKFASHVSGNSTRLFRAIAHSGSSHDSVRKLAIVGENGLRIFQVLIRSGKTPLHR